MGEVSSWVADWTEALSVFWYVGSFQVGGEDVKVLYYVWYFWLVFEMETRRCLI